MIDLPEWLLGVFVALIGTGGVTGIVTVIRTHNREPLEQKAVEATTGLTTTQTAKMEEEVAELQLDNRDRMWSIIRGLETDNQSLRKELGELRADLDVERQARVTAMSRLNAGMALAVGYVEHLRGAWPVPPPPDYPHGWSDYHPINNN